MKTITNPQSIFLILFLFSLPIECYSAPVDYSDNKDLNGLIESYYEGISEPLSIYITHKEASFQSEGMSKNRHGPTTTIYIGGASFKGKEKPKKKDSLFSQNLWFWFKRLFHGNGHYRTSTKSTRFLGIIRNSVYSMKYGNKPISARDLKRRKQKVLRKVIDEISKFYVQNGGSTCPNVNLVGSSYGSVVAAHLAIKLVEFGYKIETITLSASPIPETSSQLADRLNALKAAGKIGQIIWHPNGPGDTVTGASGNTSIFKLLFPSPGSGRESIILPSHPHNAARKDTCRTVSIVYNTLIEGETEGPAIKYLAKQAFPHATGNEHNCLDSNND